MFRKTELTFIILLAAVLCASCAGSSDTPTPTAADVPNPIDETAVPTAVVMPSPAASDTAADGCKIYHSEALGYSFHYPANARIANAENPLDSISVEGPLVNGDIWLSFTISHPNNREEYLPRPDVDLEQWLIEHNLLPNDPEQNPLGEIRKPNVPIAGTTAIHLRFDRSPQSYAYDRYYFSRAGQLYMIVIGHLGDREDWALYNHFLQSFQFGG